MYYSTLIGTPLLSNNSVLIREVLSDEGDALHAFSVLTAKNLCPF